MIAGRRARRKPLIRAAAMKAVVARNLSILDGTIRRKQDQRRDRQEGLTSYSKEISAEQTQATSVSNFTRASSQPEAMGYLRQLAALHAAGVLTDEEYFSARDRLFGS